MATQNTESTPAMAAKNKANTQDFHTITELTREFGVSTRTIRFYEDEGLIKPVRRGRTRLFRPSDRKLLKLILRGKRLGFSIAEIREILDIYKGPTGEVGQMRLLIEKVNLRRQELKQKQRDIETTLLELDNVEEACQTRIDELSPLEKL